MVKGSSCRLKRFTELHFQWRIYNQRKISGTLPWTKISSSGSRGMAKGAMPPPPVPDKDYLLWTSWHFLVKKKTTSWPLDLEAPVYNLRTKQWILWPLFDFFKKKFPASLCLVWISFFFHILLVSLCSLFHLYFIFLCAYFYIILTQTTTFLACKDWSQVFLHTLLHKNVWELINIFI